MRRDIIPQIIAISAKTADEYQAKYNEAVKNVCGFKVTGTDIDISGGEWRAVISYEISKYTIDSVADEFHLEGLRYICDQCPHMVDPNDRRVKHCECMYAEYGHTHREHEACEVFYKQLKLGKIKPIERT